MTGAIRSLDDIPQDDVRRILPRFHPENFEKNLELVRQVEALAARKRVTPGQYALAWVLAQGSDFIVIPGTKKLKYLEENCSAAQVFLTPEEVAEMRQMVEAAAPAGERYPETLMSTVDL